LQVAANNRLNPAILERLLAKGGLEIQVTQGVLKTAAENFGQRVMRQLLDRGGDDILITQDILEIAAGNSGYETV